MNLAALADSLSEAVAAQPLERALTHGFDLLIDDPGVNARLRSQAKTTLLAEHLLTTVRPKAEPLVLMKGLEVAQLYPTTYSRPFRDVDVLLSRSHEFWSECVEAGFTHRASRRVVSEHHHLPALRAPFGTIGLEIHHRPNLPGWAHIETAYILETAEASRTGFEGVLRPRDDVHALLLALHGWKSGFTRLRDLYDAILLGAVSEAPVEATARLFGLGRLWVRTVQLAQSFLLPHGQRMNPLAMRLLTPRGPGIAGRRNVRLIAPFFAVGPGRALRGHYRDYRMALDSSAPAGRSS